MTLFAPPTLARLDAFRFPQMATADHAAHKEWLHFCVHGPGLDIVVNFSVTGGAAGSPPRAQVAVLVREEQWDGDVEVAAEEEVVFRRDGLGASFGQNRLEISDEGYTISVALVDRPISMQLSLRPLASPSLKYHVPLGGGSLHWLLVPRLVAEGTVVVAGRVFRIEGAPAYHDHNWGRFDWGGDFAWEWGYGLPASTSVPWSVVFSRLSDRGHHETRMQALLLWRGARQHRVLVGPDIDVAQEGYLRPRRILKVPRVMAMLAPETTTDVPRHIEIRAAEGRDELHLRFEAEEVAQILLPNDHDIGLTIINEIRGVLRLSGFVHGERVLMEGHAIFERVDA